MAWPNQLPSTTLAVLRATPVMVSSLCISSGTLPAYSLTTFCALPMTDFALLRKKPVERISGSSCSGVSTAKSFGVGYLRNRMGVTILTRTSVHWAERMVATRSSHGLVCVRAQVTPGYNPSRRCSIGCTRPGVGGVKPLLPAADLAALATVVFPRTFRDRAFGGWVFFLSVGFGMDLRPIIGIAMILT